MSPSLSAPGAGGSAADPTPLLSSSEESSPRRGVNGIGRRSALSIARLLHRVGSRRVIEEPSMRVREAAAEHIGERQSDWAYSRPMLVFTVVWDTIILVIIFPFYLLFFRVFHLHVAKHLGSANSTFMFVWWIIGIYWVSFGGSTLPEDAPVLYWTCFAFLSADIVFFFICVLVACLVALAVCFCLPFIIAILHAVADQREGANTEAIEQLPRFIYQKAVDYEKDHGEIVESRGGIIFDKPEGSSLRGDEAVCAVCLSEYEDKSELRQLPCSHLFHSMCIDKWLRVKPTCPLCNVSILSSGEQIGHVQA